MSSADSDQSFEDLIRRVDEASQDTNSPFRIRSLLAVTPEEEGTPVAAIELAFSYRASDAGTGDQHFMSDELENGEIFPPTPKDVAPDTRDIWDAVSARAASPTVRARLHDLCFVARHGNGRDHAGAAARAYLEVADAYPSSAGDEPDRLNVALGAGQAVTRALELARRTGQDDLAAEVLAKGIEKARHSLEDPDAGPGVVLRLLRPLAADVDAPAEVDELLTEAREKYKDDVWNTMSTIQAQLLRPGLGAQVRQDLHGQTVEALIRAANSAQPMIAMMHLQDAARVAQQHHLHDLYGDVVSRLQALSGSDLGMAQIKVPVQLDEAAIEAWFDQITGQTSWEAALVELLRSGPPTGQVEANREFAEQMPSIAPLSSIFPTMGMGPDGLPRYTASSDDADNYLSQVEMHRLQITGPLWAEAFRRIGEKWSPMDLDELSTFLGQGLHVPDDVARALGRSVIRHFEGHHEAAAFTALPKVERIAREILLLLGVPVFRPPSSGSPGSYVGLGSLIDSLEERILDPSWARFLFTLLASHTGANLRNEALHGSIVELGEGHSALILLSAIYLAVGIRSERQSEPTGE